VVHDLLNFTRHRRLPIIRQAEAAECGLACLAMIASYHGHEVDLNTMRRRYPVSLKGVTLRALIQIAGNLKLVCRPLRLEPAHLQQLRLPSVLHWDMNHFVVLQAVSRKEIVIHDPACGKKRYSLTEASKHLTGVALELLPAPGFDTKNERVRLPLRAFWWRTAGIGHALLQILLLSIVLEALVVAGPFYMQLTVDEVIARGDLDFLTILALGFGLLMLIKVASTAIRSQIILIVQNTLHYQLGVRLFHHLVRLPLAYFEKRHIGDLLSRFTSIEPIRNLFAEGLIAAAIDGLMAVATLAMLFIYSARLAGFVLAATLAYMMLRLGLYRMFRERSETVITNKAREDSVFIETMRAMQSLKLFNREGERENQWLHRHADVINANVGLGRARISFKLANDVIFGLENIVVIYFAARLAVHNVLTVGMIFAFISYKTSFTDKAVLLVEKALDFRILDLHLERLADIALSPPEKGHDQALTHQREIWGGIELRNVCFRYAESEPFVLEGINLKIEPGRFVTIAGPSGGGKTTLVKIMLGLLEPTSGEILVDGMPLQTIGARAFREQVGAVMQEDQLLSGSIADNICFFDPAFEHEWMIECAKLARIHDEIMAMPMAYNSLIGDMGSSLSGGQKQRVLLARALYRRPKLLFLDEGTAHLDIETERVINENLRKLEITRISVAHRPGVIGTTDEVFHVNTIRKGRSSTALPSRELPKQTAKSSGETSVAPDADAPDNQTLVRGGVRITKAVVIIGLSGFLIAACFPNLDALWKVIDDHVFSLITMRANALFEAALPLLPHLPSSTGHRTASPEPERKIVPARAEVEREPAASPALAAARIKTDAPHSPPAAKPGEPLEQHNGPDVQRWGASQIPLPATDPPDENAHHWSSGGAQKFGDAQSTSSKDGDGVLIERGDRLLLLGDITSARLFYERALATGSRRAATALGKTHDPRFLLQVQSLRGVISDVTRAMDWYRQGAQAGDAEAMDRLRQLEATYSR
jgi:ATP-binding cassette, subfamily B, bacterial CvaB/MchF/RaxB